MRTCEHMIHDADEHMMMMVSSRWEHIKRKMHPCEPGNKYPLEVHWVTDTKFRVIEYKPLK